MSVLRQGVIAALVVVLASAIVLFALGLVEPGILTLACWAGFLLVAVLVERSQYKRTLTEPPPAPWRRSGERFIDPETGGAVEVYEEPATGRRAYVAVDGATGA